MRSVLLTVVAALLIGATGSLAVPALEKDRNALWKIVHNICVRHWVSSDDAWPCALIVASDESENGVAILKDIRGKSQFLAIVTSRISGIESSALEGPTAPNLFGAAWDARTFVFDRLGKVLPRGNVGLAINSALRRSQDQVHIHIDCLKPDARDIISKCATELGSEWSEELFIVDAPYRARRLDGLDLSKKNPFDLVAEYLASHGQELRRASIVVAGIASEDNKPGFIVLLGLADESHLAFGHGENLLDHECKLAD